MTTALRNADLSRVELLLGLRALQPRFQAAGVTGMILFGSRARGDNRPDSDIDLMIEVDDRAKFSLIDLAGVGNLIEDEFGLPAGLVMRRSVSDEFLLHSLPDHVKVF